MDFVRSVDWNTALFFNHFVGKSDNFDRIVVAIANANIVKGGLIIPYFWALWFKRKEDIYPWRGFVVRAIVAALFAILLARTLQLLLPFHLRPIFVPNLHLVLPVRLLPEAFNGWNSFPSDHVVLFGSLTTAVWASRRAFGWGWGVAAILWLIVIIALPRLYLGIHFLSDAVGGAIIGFAVMMVALKLPLARFDAWVLGLELRASPLFYALGFWATYQLVELFNDIRFGATGLYHIVTGNPAVCDVCAAISRSIP